MERLLTLLNKLNTINGFVTNEELAKSLSVTERTIRTDLKKIEELLLNSDIKLIKKRGEGVSLSPKNIDECVFIGLVQNLNSNRDFYSSYERENIIINELLTTNKAISLSKIEELTLSSKTSVIKNLVNVENYFDKWGIRINKKPKLGIYLSYGEYEYRQVVVDRLLEYTGKIDYGYLCNKLINDEGFESTLDNCDFINLFLSDVNTMRVANFVKKYESDNNLRFTDKALISIIFYICVSEVRIRMKKELIEESYELINFFDERNINELIIQSIKGNKSSLKILESKYEMQHLLVYLLSQKQNINGGYTQGDFLLEDDIFNAKALKLVKEFISIAQEKLNCKFDNDKVLLDNLLIHMKPTVYRLLFGIKLDNPLTTDIIRKYPAVFKACKEASVVFERELNKHADDNEICYLALHIGASIEKSKGRKDNNVYRVLIVCPEGNGTSSILYYRLLNSFPNIQIENTCSVTEFNKYGKDNIDIIVSTVPIYTGNKYNTINVNPLLHDKDIENISKAMRRVDMEKNSTTSYIVEDIMSIVSNHAAIKHYNDLQNDLIKYFNKDVLTIDNDQVTLEDYLKESLIEVNYNAENWSQAFEKSGTLLLQNGYIEAGYIYEMIQSAKKYGSYMILGNGVALPHAKITDGSIKTGFSFVTLSNPVVFYDNNREYNLKMIVCLAADNNYNHINAMGELISILNDDYIDTLVSSKTKIEFIENMKKILKY